jgi:hypothetical protein
MKMTKTAPVQDKEAAVKNYEDENANFFYMLELNNTASTKYAPTWG